MQDGDVYEAAENNLIDPNLLFGVFGSLWASRSIVESPDKGFGGGYANEATGRAEPQSLKEKIALDVVVADPKKGIVLPITMTDPRWPASDGWVKMAQNVNGVEIHYIYNTRTGQYTDFKFK